MNDPDVSVVIPTRNRWRLLRTTLGSALRQDGIEHEVLVVDDGSSDETPLRLRDVRDRRLRVIRHENSRGVAVARNRGIAEARGAWIAFLDDDDLWSPAKLRAQMAAAERRGAGFAYSGSVRIDERWRVIAVDRPPEPDRLGSALLERNAIPAGSSNVLVKADLLREVGTFDERLFQLADWDLWLRIAAAASGAAVPEPLVAYLKHADNMLLERDRDPLAELRYISKKHDADMRGAGVQLSRWMALNHLSAGRRTDAVAVYLRGAWRYRCPRHVLRAARAALSRRAGETLWPGAQDIPAPEWLISIRPR